jgi:hypothetical protein
VLPRPNNQGKRLADGHSGKYIKLQLPGMMRTPQHVHYNQIIPRSFSIKETNRHQLWILRTAQWILLLPSKATLAIHAEVPLASILFSNGKSRSPSSKDFTSRKTEPPKTSSTFSVGQDLSLREFLFRLYTLSCIRLTSSLERSS